MSKFDTFIRRPWGRLLAFCAAFLLAALCAAQPAPAPLPPDVRMVIDISGSMKRNDPNNLRQPAVELLVQLLPKDSRAGIWTFGRWVNMLVNHQQVDAQWREQALLKAKEINSVGLYTNIGEALERAALGVDAASNTHNTSILLLTDGMVDIDKDPAVNQREWRRIVDEVLPKLKAAGITVHTIALSEGADVNLLNKLSISTDGVAAVAKTADDLMKIFLKAFSAAAPAEEVPLGDEGFVIDSSVEEFTALIFRSDAAQQTQLIGPDQEVLTAVQKSAYVNWYRADNYDLITVKQPLEGQWQVVADMDPDSRVTVVSNLNLRVRPMPLNVVRGQRVGTGLLLQEDGKTIVDPAFLKLMDIQATLVAGRDEFDLREIWRQTIATANPPGTGIFELSLPEIDKEGIYQLSIRVDGKSFVREFNHQFTTRLPFDASIAQQYNEGRTEYVLTAKSFDPTVIVDRTQVVATVVAPDQSKKIRPLSPTQVDTWQTTISPELEGEYRAVIKVRGENEGGTRFDADLEPLSFTYSITQGFVKEEKPFFSPTPSPEPSPSPQPSPVASPEATATPEPAPADEGKWGAWMLYGLLGIGNLLLFGVGYLVFKKVLRGDKDEEVLEQFAEEKIVPPPPPPEPEEDDFEEEPPMEDIDPSDDDEPPMAAIPEPSEPEVAVEAASDDIDLESALAGMDFGDDDLTAASPDAEPEPAPEPAPEPEPEPAEEDPMDALDDLDQMAVEAEEKSAEAEEPEEDEEDMVSAMLKAQGLDLAEDELDDAISSLIDELENEDNFDDDDFK